MRHLSGELSRLQDSCSWQVQACPRWASTLCLGPGTGLEVRLLVRHGHSFCRSLLFPLVTLACGPLTRVWPLSLLSCFECKAQLLNRQHLHSRFSCYRRVQMWSWIHLGGSQMACCQRSHRGWFGSYHGSILALCPKNLLSMSFIRNLHLVWVFLPEAWGAQPWCQLKLCAR